MKVEQHFDSEQVILTWKLWYDWVYAWWLEEKMGKTMWKREWWTFWELRAKGRNWRKLHGDGIPSTGFFHCHFSLKFSSHLLATPFILESTSFMFYSNMPIFLFITLSMSVKFAVNHFLPPENKMPSPRHHSLHLLMVQWKKWVSPLSQGGRSSLLAGAIDLLDYLTNE